MDELCPVHQQNLRTARKISRVSPPFRNTSVLMRPSKALVLEGARFLTVSVLGVLVDLAIAYWLATTVGLPLWLAAVFGFFVAAVFNYTAHEIWTFRAGARAVSFARSIKYLTVSVVTLLSRIAIVIPLERAMPEQTLTVLICAAGVSFFVNFALSKVFVFSISTTEAKQSHD